MRRREFLCALGGTAAWPLTAYGQGRAPLVLVWFGGSAGDPETQRRHDIVRDALRELGWIDGRNVRLEYRSSMNAEQNRAVVAEIAALSPSVILTGTAPGLPPNTVLQQYFFTVIATDSTGCSGSVAMKFTVVI